PYDIPNFESMEGDVLSLEKDTAVWIPLPEYCHSRKVTQVVINKNSEGIYSNTTNVTTTNYEAELLRKKLIKSDEKDYYLGLTSIQNHSLEIDSVQVDNLRSHDEKLSVTVFGTYADELFSDADMIYLNLPMLSEFGSNPFNNADREYPVEFSYPKEETVVFTIMIPEGYQLEDSKKPMMLKLIDGSVEVRYNMQQSSNIVQVLFNAKINSTFVPYENYLLLKEIFDLYINAINTPIVLKRVQ
ncbi:MAG: hypothetical protein OEY34_04600, partial [Cyclobacteriaceae bacterium]|nr:hypothetical protein [Cyclobacteriaceae bacterium]